MRASALIVLLAGVEFMWAGVDVNAIVDQSVRNYERDWRAAAKDWTCLQTDVTRSPADRKRMFPRLCLSTARRMTISSKKTDSR